MVLSKPLTHLRPLLRSLPSSAPNPPTPDHFTANPSLLHHLPQQSAGSSSHALLTTGQSTAASSGSSGHAGRAGGKGYGAGSGGGYTGHARAFLSLPQTSTLDPSSSLSTQDERERNRSARLLLRHRLAHQGGPTTRVVRIEDVKERQMGRRVRLVEMEQEERMLEGLADEGGKGKGRRRSSIAFPTTARPPVIEALPPPTPAPTVRHSTRPRHLIRSSTTLDLWQLAAPSSSSSPQLFRSVSTRSGTIPLPELDESDALREIELIPRQANPLPPLQSANHVLRLQDLAGLDGLSARRVGGVRRHSTASMERPLSSSSSDPPPPLSADAIDESIPDEQFLSVEPPSASAGRQASVGNVGQRIYSSIRSATARKDYKTALALADHYRSPRTASPFSAASPGDARLSANFPLETETGYNTATYNACLDAILQARQPGGTIAPLLECYNEMLERDVVPNSKTYLVVIRGLCSRERDVANAVRTHEKIQAQADWQERFYPGSVAIDRQEVERQRQLIEGYKAEGNLASAMKLFLTAVLRRDHRGGVRSTDVFFQLLVATAEGHSAVDAEELLGIWRHLRESESRALMRGCYGVIFQCLQRAGKDGQSALEEVWKDFKEEAEEPEAGELAETQAIRDGWAKGVRAWVGVGDADKAEEIVREYLARQDVEDAQRTFIVTGLVLELAKAGHAERVQRWMFPAEGEPQHAAAMRRSAKAIVAQDLAVQGHAGIGARVLLLCEVDSDGTYSDRRHIRRTVERVYMALLARTDPAEPLDVDLALQVIKMAGGGAHVPLQAVDAHIRALLAAGTADLMRGLLQAVDIPERDLVAFSEEVKSVMSEVTEISFGDWLAVYGAFARRDVQIEKAETVMGRYREARASGLTLNSEQWRALACCVSLLPTQALAEGEYDESLLALVGDLGAAQVRLSTPEEAPLAHAVIERFGRTRAKEVLGGWLDQERVDKVTGVTVTDRMRPTEGVNEDVPAISGREDAPSLTSGSDSFDEFTLPATPTSSAEPSQDLAPSSGEQRLRLSIELTDHIDRQATPFATPQVAQAAYKTIREHLARPVPEVPLPTTLARLLTLLSRQGGEPQVLELYALAQTTLPLVYSAEQARMWHAVEDAMIVANCHMGHLERAGMHRARILEQGLVPSADAYAQMIASSKDTTDDALVARELWDEARGLGVRPNLFLFNTVISKLSKARKAEMALEMFGVMKRLGVTPSSVTYGALINACCRVGDGVSAENLFNEMTSMRNFKPRVPPYNTMMQYYLLTEPNRAKLLHYYGLLRSVGQLPSAHTYKLLLDCYATLQPIDIASAESVFAELVRDPKVTVQGTHWASLVNAYGVHLGDVTKARELFDSIPSHPQGGGMVPEPVVWEAILNVLATKGTVEELEQMRQRMIDSGARATAYVYNVLIAGYARAGDIDRAREVFASMGDSVVGVAAPNNHPQLLTSGGHVKPSTMTEEPTGLVYREPSTYEAMIRAEIRCGDRAKAEEVLARMEERGYPGAVVWRARGVLDEPQVQAQA